MLYFLDRYPTAATNVGPLSVTISATPLAQDILKYKVSESLLIFLLNIAPLRPREQGIMGLDEIAKPIDSEHGIDVNIVEKCRNVSNSRGKVKMMHLLSLAGMAC